MDNNLQQQLENFNQEAKEELREILNDPEKYNEIKGLINKNPITLEDHSGNSISLMEEQDLINLKKLINSVTKP